MRDVINLTNHYRLLYYSDFNSQFFHHKTFLVISITYERHKVSRVELFFYFLDMRRPQVLSIAHDFLVQGAQENHAHEKKIHYNRD
jgi:hypothetical protein